MRYYLSRLYCARPCARLHVCGLAWQAEERALKSSRQDKERSENLANDRRRILLHQREMDSLMYALNGARIFFKEDDDGQTVKESGGGGDAASVA